MIELRITGETSKEFLENLFAASAAMGGNTPEQPPAEPAVPSAEGKSSTRKKSPAPAESGATTPPADPPAASDTSTAKPGDATPSREEIAKKAMAYGAPTKGGPNALKELFTQHGSANGKWSEVPNDQLPAINIRLDELLA